MALNSILLVNAIKRLLCFANLRADGFGVTTLASYFPWTCSYIYFFLFFFYGKTFQWAYPCHMYVSLYICEYGQRLAQICSAGNILGSVVTSSSISDPREWRLASTCSGPRSPCGWDDSGMVVVHSRFSVDRTAYGLAARGKRQMILLTTP